MPVAVITATVREMKSALGFAGGGVAGIGMPERWSWRGREYILTACGVGPIKAALGIGALLAGGDVDGVLNPGIAGSFDLDDLPLGSVCAADREIWPEYGLETESGPDPHGLGFPQGVVDGVEIWDTVELDPNEQARRMGMSLPGDVVAGTSLTVGTVTGTLESARRLRNRYNAVMENMEGFSLALGCAEAGIPFLEIRTISNRVGSREEWDAKSALGLLGKTVRRVLSGEE